MNNVVIRELTIDDYDQIISLWADSGLPYKPKGRDSRSMIAKEMDHTSSSFWGAFDEAKMLAVGIANFDGRRGWINRVAVHPDFRGIKLAQNIITACESYLYSVGAVVICALIEEINYPSISCFKNEDYNPEREIIYFTKRKSKLD